MKYTFTVVITNDPEEVGVFLASVPALPGCHTWGASEEEAFENAKDAALCCIESMKRDGEAIPVEVAHMQQELVCEV